MHHETASLGEEVDKLSAVVRKLAAKVMWIAGTPITGGAKSVPQPEIDALLARAASAEDASKHDALSDQFKSLMEEMAGIADNDGVSVPPQFSRLLSASAEEPRPMLISVPHKNQPGEDLSSTSGKGPVGPSWTGRPEETLTTSPPATREVPAENPRPSPKQSADEPQPSPAEEPRLQGCGLRERAGAGYEDTPMPSGNPRSAYELGGTVANV